MHMAGDCSFLLTLFTTNNTSCHIAVLIRNSKVPSTSNNLFASHFPLVQHQKAWCISYKVDLISVACWYLIDVTLLIWLSHWLLDNAFTVRLGTCLSKTFHHFVELENNTNMRSTIQKKCNCLLTRFCHITKSRLWQVHDIYNTLRLISINLLYPVVFFFHIGTIVIALFPYIINI
jgi:hypothetical protein